MRRERGKLPPGSRPGFRQIVQLLDRRGILPGMALGLATAIGAVPAAAQQLWNIEEVTARRVPRVVMDGAAMGAAAGGAPTGETATVQVAFDYLRLGMGRLELPLMDGSVIEAENAVFEDRGGGNLMWTGEVPGAGYESVLFTVQDGRLVGWFGVPGGPKYVVYAGPDGRGSLAVEAGPTGDWCGVEAGSGPAQRGGGAGPGPDRDLERAAAAAGSRPATAASQSDDSRLDILTIYPGGTEAYWRVIGGPAVGIQQLADYLNMVFRNGAIPATANLIPVRWDPRVANHPRTQGAHHNDDAEWHWKFTMSEEIASFRRRHRPDLVHFIPNARTEVPVAAGGMADLRWSLDPRVLTGWSTPGLATFAHEIGHNLGGHHEPAEISRRTDFAEYQSRAFRPWMFGHTDMTSCARREGRGDLLSCPVTIMSYGLDALNEPDHVPSREPFYSSVRRQPNGWTIGVAGTSEVERVLHETVSVAVQSSEAPWNAEQVPRSVTGARWTGHDAVRVDWSEDWRSKDGGNVYLALAEGANDAYYWSWDREGSSAVLSQVSDPNLAPIIGSDGSQVGIEIAGLRPGGRYRVAVRGRPWRYDRDTQTLTKLLASDVFHVKPRRSVSGSPAPASNVGARVTGPDSIRLHWRDNSQVESGYEVWHRKWSGEEPDDVWRRHGTPLPAGTRHVEVDGLTAEEEIGLTDGSWEEGVLVPGPTAMRGRYSFVVVAYNDQGWNASETFELEFMPGPHLAPTVSGEITDCYRRRTGIDLDGYRVLACLETPDGGRRRMWDHQLESDQSGLLYFFDRGNAEILVKVLDGCAINGHRWVFVAPVTTLSFRLVIEEPGPLVALANRRRFWHYDSERRPQDRIPQERTPDHDRVGNPTDETARTVSDTTAFPCTTAEIAAARASSGLASSDFPDQPGLARRLPRSGRFDGILDGILDGRGAGIGAAASGAHAAPASPVRLSAGSSTDCEPGGPTLTLRGGYTVSMCYETREGRVGDALDWGLDSSQSGLMYFFDRDNAEVLIKVLDGCGVNGHHWVFVAPVTDLAFNLRVESPEAQVWTHTNRLGQTADAASDISAFPCAALT